ncbi:WD40 repeat domain-containing protein [Deinococcus sp. YIM 77859]|uniref:WD40 repeat domain-containing protein n=1 Tax=Deinococcus sp. YIM 77859 TaxID=1540221 RepID=UPI001E5FC608|nr:WD40 repeat domain-containing protein [Deinococcus sp. YIM 77859]
MKSTRIAPLHGWWSCFAGRVAPRLALFLLAVTALVLLSLVEAAPGETRVPPDPLVLVGVAPGAVAGLTGTPLNGVAAVRGRYSAHVRLLDAVTGESRGAVFLPPEVQLSIPPALSRDGRWLAVVLTPDPLTRAGRVGILSTLPASPPGFQKILSAGGLTGTLNLAFSPDGTRLAAGNRQGYAQLWDWQAGRRVATVASQGGFEPTRLEFSPDGRLFAPIFRGQTRTRIFDAQTGELRTTLNGVGYGSFTPDSRGFLASRGRLINLADGKEAPTPLYLVGTSGVIGFSADGTRVLVRRTGVDVQGREWLELREVASGRTLGALTRVWDGWPEALSPDGTTLIGGDGEGGIRLLPLAPR